MEPAGQMPLSTSLNAELLASRRRGGVDLLAVQAGPTAIGVDDAAIVEGVGQRAGQHRFGLKLADEVFELLDMVTNRRGVTPSSSATCVKLPCRDADWKAYGALSGPAPTVTQPLMRQFQRVVSF